LENGKIIIAFLTPLIGGTVVRGGSEVDQADNYGWLPRGMASSLAPKLVSASGSELRLVDQAHPFANYYAAFRKDLRFSAYVDRAWGEFDGGVPFIANATNHVVGFSVNALHGVAVFLPTFVRSEDNDRKFKGVLLDILRDYYQIDIRPPAPDWVADYDVPGVTQRDAQLADLEKAIQNLVSEKARQTATRDNLADFRVLLYEQGHLLQDKVVEALQLMGFDAKTVIVKNTDYDVVFQANEGRAIAEVEGRDSEAIHKSKVDQLLSAINQDATQTGGFAKGVLIGNPYRKSKPEDRPEPFTATAIDLARQYRFAMVLTSDLYRVVLHVLREPQDDAYKQACRQALFNAEGEIVCFP
jgi:hypothetical protein